MPRRCAVLATSQYYHVFNRGSAKQPIFLTARHYSHFLETLSFYRSYPHRISLSQFQKLSIDRRTEYLGEILSKTKQLVNIFCFCLMPNHYHFLLRQREDDGITRFIGLVQNSYAKYFNMKEDRVGPLFQGRFVAVLVETDEQLLHLSRYIHLNPYTSYIVKSLTGLKPYPWSSFGDYLGKQIHKFIETDLIVDSFDGSYEKFVLDQADYQRKLGEIKHLAVDY